MVEAITQNIFSRDKNFWIDKSNADFLLVKLSYITCFSSEHQRFFLTKALRRNDNKKTAQY